MEGTGPAACGWAMNSNLFVTVQNRAKHLLLSPSNSVMRQAKIHRQRRFAWIFVRICEGTEQIHLF